MWRERTCQGFARLAGGSVQEFLHKQGFVDDAIEAAVVADHSDLCKAELAIERDRRGIACVDGKLDLLDVALGGMIETSLEQAATNTRVAMGGNNAHAEHAS